MIKESFLPYLKFILFRNLRDFAKGEIANYRYLLWGKVENGLRLSAK